MGARVFSLGLLGGLWLFFCAALYWAGRITWNECQFLVSAGMAAVLLLATWAGPSG